VICERVEVDDTGMTNLHRIRGDPLIPESTPGFLHVWIFLLAELDCRRSVGHVEVEAAEFAPPAVTFDLPGGSCVRDRTRLRTAGRGDRRDRHRHGTGAVGRIR